METLLRPATALLARLSYAKKIILVAAVLALPLAIVSFEYVGVERAQIAFSDREIVGVRYLIPVNQLFTALVLARHQIAMRTTPDVSVINGAAQTVTGADNQDGADLGVHDIWANAQPAISAATSGTDPKAAIPAYNTAIDHVLALVSAVGDNSNLTLDPDIDTYYVMDAVMFRTPILLDTPMRAIDLALIDHPDGRFATPVLLAQTAAMAGKTEAAVNDLESGLGKALAATASAHLKALRDQISTVVTTHRNGQKYVTETTEAGKPLVVQPRMLSDVTTQTGALAAALLPILGELLNVRVTGLSTHAYTTGAGAALAVLVVLYLMTAFYRSATTQLTGTADALARLASGDLTQRRPIVGRDEVGRMATAFNHALDQLTEVMTGLDRSAGAVSRSVHELTTVNEQLTSQAIGTSRLATGVGGAVQSASHDLQSLSAGSSEMLVATEEIARSASEAAVVAVSASELAIAAQQIVSGLGRSSAEIGEVVKVITAIAGQTNLLALNATIEAARAGDAGKGFAVVAGEVKDLAQETAKATDGIVQRVGALQADSSRIAAAIDEIVSVVHRIDDFQASIAAAAEEQTATTNEMTRNVNNVAAATASIAADVEHVVTSTEQTSTSADITGQAARELAETAVELRAFVDRFTLTTA